MGVQRVDAYIQATRTDGPAVTDAEFLSPLSPLVDGTFDVASKPSRGAWESALVCFPPCICGEDVAGAEAFERDSRELWERIAMWIDARAERLSSLRTDLLTIRLFVTIDMDANQMELYFPVALLAACARARLPIGVLSNDF